MRSAETSALVRFFSPLRGLCSRRFVARVLEAALLKR